MDERGKARTIKAGKKQTSTEKRKQTNIAPDFDSSIKQQHQRSSFRHRCLAGISSSFSRPSERTVAHGELGDACCLAPRPKFLERTGRWFDPYK